ncbi:SIMPL domain-containing protein [Bordetella sp. 2513F-2]
MSGRHAFTLNKLAAACCAALALGAYAPAQAQSDAQEQSTAAPASSAQAPRLSLQATASSEVMQDTVRITLSAEVEGPDQPAAGKALTNALDDVVKRARGTQDVDVRTGGFNVWPNTNDKGKIVNWRGQGQVVLESKDFAAASALASKLSDKTAISNIVFTLSREAREAEERKLLKQAADAFRERALAATNAFGFTGYRLVEIHLGGAGAPAPMPRAMAAPMMMAKEARAADVPLEADDVTVSVSVNGTISLQ